MTALLRPAWHLAGRNLLLMLRQPLVLIPTFALPPLIMLIFLALFRRLSAAQGLDYAQFVAPAVALKAVLFAGMGAAYSIGLDARDGLLDRWRALPVSRMALLVARAVADVVRGVASLAVFLAVAVALGFSMTTRPQYLVAFVVLCLLIVVVVSLGSSVLGLRGADPETTDALMLPIVTGGMMLSSGFAPAGNFPAWLRPLVEANPMSLTVEALRALAAGGVDVPALAGALAWAVALGCLWGWMFTRRYTRDG